MKSFREDWMKISNVKSLAIPEIKVIRYGRFADSRGFFSEHFRKSDFENLHFMKGIDFLQCNESCSKPGTIRGLHFQWSPYMGKLVRTLSGCMTDLVLDIRKGSPGFGKIIGYEMPADLSVDFGEWIWIPPGFAHGNFYTQNSCIEYFCSGEYSPGCEAGISPLATDIDWSLFDPELKKKFDAVVAGNFLITDKDRSGHSLESWKRNPNSDRFVLA
jgi:dTDP-4-dehydrorhamnose 3,5-epimerase